MIYYVRKEVMNKNIRFLSSVLVLGLFGIAGADAAPSVKMLGTNSARVGNNATVVRSAKPSNTTSSTQRLGSIRAKTTNTAAPVTINKVATATGSLNSVGADESRLSLGKYIHSSGVASGNIKPVTMSSEFVTLSDRVSDLEAVVDTKQAELSVSGEGLVLENNTISLDSTMAALPGRVSDLENDLSTNYYTKDEISDVLDDQIGSDINTVYNVATGTRTYVSIVDDFDEEEVLN